MAKHAGQKAADDNVLAQDNLMRFNNAYDAGHEEYVDNAKKCNSYYAGEQWDKADKATLDSEGRPALTLNLVLSTVNVMIGEMLERKVDVTFKDNGGGATPNTAYAVTALVKQIMNANDYDDKEEDAYTDGVITDRGYMDIRMDFTKNMQGDITIATEDPIDIIPDPEAKDADPKTWNEVFITRWLTPDQIGQRYGMKKREEILKKVDTGHQTQDDNFDYYSQTFGGDNVTTHVDQSDEKRLRRVRVIERQYFKLDNQLMFVDLETGDMRPVPYGTKEDEVEIIAEEYGFGYTKQQTRRVRMCVSCDSVLLYDDWSIYRTFTIVPYFPYFRRGKPFGVVRNLLDPQNLLNKTSSQELHIVNTTANSGWIVEEDSLVDMDPEDLEERGAKTGLVLTHRRNSAPPLKIQPNQIPAGIDRISQKAASTVREISAVNASMLGTARADQSGRAQEASISRGQIQVSVVLKNLKRMRKHVAEKILELVQDFYTETRYFKIVSQSLFSGESEEGHAINAMGDDGNIINDVTIGKYDIQVGYAPISGTTADIQMEEALRLRELGIAIPDHVMVEYSNLTKKTEIVEFLKNSQGFGEPSEEQQQLEEFEMEHKMRSLQLQLEDLDADITLKQAKAEEAEARADSLEGMNEMQLEIRKLEQQREEKDKELSLRIALAARSHQSQDSLNQSRMGTQIAMKSMDMMSKKEDEKKKPQTEKRGK